MCRAAGHGCRQTCKRLRPNSVHAAAVGSQMSRRRPTIAGPVSAAIRGPTWSMTKRVPKGRRRRSTDTTSLEDGRPDAVTPGPVWQVTSNTPSGVPRLLVEPVVGAAAVADAGGVATAAVPVGGEGAAGVPLVSQPASSTAPARPTGSRIRRVPSRGRRHIR
jgi:hypothetical protein